MMTTGRIIDLTPADNHKSFYGKARAEINGDTITLISYNTRVLRIQGGEIVRLWGGWSATTQRHINAFLATFADGQSGKAFFDSLPYEQ